MASIGRPSLKYRRNSSVSGRGNGAEDNTASRSQNLLSEVLMRRGRSGGVSHQLLANQ